MIAGGSQNPRFFGNYHNCQKESNLANVKAGDSDPLFLSNALEAFGRVTDVKQRYNEPKDKPANMSCLSNSFKVLKTHSREAFCYSSVL